MTAIDLYPFELTNGRGEHEHLRVKTAAVPRATAPVLVPTGNEEVLKTFAGVVTIVTANGAGAQTLADAGGILSFTPERVFGLLVEGSSVAGKLSLPPSGTGTTVAFSVAREYLDEIDERRGGVFGKLRAVALIGDNLGLIMSARGVLHGAQGFEQARSDVYLAFVSSWVKAK
jgi:hypothetical protein